MLRNLSIGAKLTLMMLVSTGVALAVAGTGFVLFDQSQVRGIVVRDTTAVALIIAENSAAALAFDDAAAGEATLQTLRVRPLVAQACLYRADGGVLTAYARNGSPACPRAQYDAHYFTPDVFGVFRGVVVDNTRVGTAYIEYSLADVKRRRSVYLQMMTVLIGLGLLAAWGVSRVLQRAVAGPLSDLAGTARSVATSRDYRVRARKHAEDELGILVDAFNEMLENIERRDAQLEHAKEDLEHRVEQRTSELRQELTERRRAESALERQRAELERSNAELQQFAYVASHDLQEPLRMVAVYAKLLGERYKGRLDADADEFIGYAVEGAERMQELIHDLLAYSRVGSRGRPFVRTGMNEALQAALANLQAAIQESGAVISADPLPEIDGDPGQMKQLFQNLLSNALKFRRAQPPWIRVTAGRQDGQWRFAVSDNGIGIAPEHRERIFDIFQRLHDREEYPGTGIGLAICQRIIERHGGRIWVESNAAGGSTFYFTIGPSSQPDTESEQINAIEPSVTRKTG